MTLVSLATMAALCLAPAPRTDRLSAQYEWVGDFRIERVADGIYIVRAPRKIEYVEPVERHHRYSVFVQIQDREAIIHVRVGTRPLKLKVGVWSYFPDDSDWADWTWGTSCYVQGNVVEIKE